jgi:membrane protease YdiL (CAAX protease family)
MLFNIKNNWFHTLALAFTLAVVSIGILLAYGTILALGTLLDLGVRTGIALGCIMISDMVLHGLFSLTLGRGYRLRFREHVFYFERQGVAEVLASGPLAFAEELLFRGVILGGLLLVGLPAWVAIGIAAVLFGLAHHQGRKELMPFTVWAIWEGIILGTAYVWLDSLWAVAIAHAIHDAWGFAVFLYQRKTGFLLEPIDADDPLESAPS